MGLAQAYVSDVVDMVLEAGNCEPSGSGRPSSLALLNSSRLSLSLGSHKTMHAWVVV